MTDNAQDVVVRVEPIPEGNAVDYLQEIAIPVSVINKSSTCVVVDTIILKFHTDWPSAALHAVHEETCSEFALNAGEDNYRKIAIVPKPILYGPSNYFSVQVVYHDRDTPSRLLSEVTPPSQYVIIRLPPETKGRAFISYKHPEDAGLADVLQKIARRAGFSPYIASADARPGTTIWKKKIPPAIRKSRRVFVIWTKVTPFGEGVSREINIARKAGIRVIPLVEKGAAVPGEYKSMSREITWFSRDSAPVEFSRAVVESRGRG